jgi:hypothetical protein
MITLSATIGRKSQHLVYTIANLINDRVWLSIQISAETFVRKADEAINAWQEHIKAFIDAVLPEDY